MDQRQENAISNLIVAAEDLLRNWEHNLTPFVQALRKALDNPALRPTIIIEVEGGCVQDVHGLPEGWAYELDDRDPV